VAKIRVYEVARRFAVSSEAMVNLLKDMDVPVKNHMSSIDDETVAKIEAKFEAEKEAVKHAQEEKKKKLEEAKKKRRRRRAAAAPKEEEAKSAAPAKAPSQPSSQKSAPAKRPEGRKRRRRRRRKVDQKAVEENIRKTMAKIEGRTTRKRQRPKKQEVEIAKEEPENLVKVTEFVSAGELADLIEVPVNKIIATCMELGLMVTINQRLDFDTISLICEEFGFAAQRQDAFVIEEPEEEEEETGELVSRPPVVTVMGHVDHGKTSLLDHIRHANVIAGESGGITQHIGAYEVAVDGDRSLTFLDTPGHEAFTAMRARGAQVTDIVILVVAADDSVMPQTIEAIDHARAAGVPVVVAINKTDLPDARSEKVKQALTDHNVVVEEFGGEVLCAEVSAKTGDGIDELMEKVLLQAEVLDLQGNPQRSARGVVVEAELDRGMGPLATILVTAGTLKVGESFICGVFDGKVRALLDERGRNVKEAGPSTPVRVLGFNGVPEVGDSFAVLGEDREARDMAQQRQRLQREQGFRRTKEPTALEDLYEQVRAGEEGRLNLILKGDVGGSVEALADELEKISAEEVRVEVLHRGVGAITERDVVLAAASDAIVIGFHVRPDTRARAAAEREGVDIRLYKVIYEVTEDVRKAMEGLLTPEEREVVLGSAEIRETFKVPRVGTVAGCFVADGTIPRTAKVRVVRDGVEIYQGVIGSLRRFKDDVREVREGFECGINVEGFNDVKVGDVIEAFTIEEVQRTLA
jgi:translation initiation factor IF-2